VAAGNDYQDANNYSPANCSYAITVSAIADYNGLPGGGPDAVCALGEPYSYKGPDDSLAVFSNFGEAIDVAASGVCLLSTGLGGGSQPFGGTSAASPHIAGAFMLFKWMTGYTGTTYGPTVIQAMTSAGWTFRRTVLRV
jgi:subtilisin family serine protease